MPPLFAGWCFSISHAMLFVSISFVVFFYEFDASFMGPWVQGIRGLELWLGRSTGRILVMPYDGHWVFAV